MKKLLIFMLTNFLLLSSSYAIEWLPFNQRTVIWDPPTKTISGQSLGENDIIKYNTYMRREGAGEIIFHSTVDQPKETFTMPPVQSEGKWLVGIQPIRFVGGAEPGIESDPDQYTWSDSQDPVKVPKPFGFIYWEPSAAVTALRKWTP